MIHSSPGYRVYLAASSGNPGSSAATVLVTKGDQQAERTIELPDASLDDMVVAGFELTLKLVAEKPDLVTIVTECLWISLSVQDGIAKNKMMQASHALWLAACARRAAVTPPQEPMKIELLQYRPRNTDEELDRKRMDNIRAVAYLIAFPKDIYLPPLKPSKLVIT